MNSIQVINPTAANRLSYRTALLLRLVISICAASVAVGAQTPADKTPAPSQTAGQTTGAVASSTGPSVSQPSETDDRYRIGPGDVLDIRIFNRANLSRDAVRVEGNGMIRMPLIDSEIRAACKT